MKKITFEGQRKTLREWAELKGLNKTTLSARLQVGWSVAKALSVPVKPLHRKDTSCPSLHPSYNSWARLYRLYCIDGTWSSEVCERWHSPAPFLEDMGEYKPRQELLRKDTSLPYSKDNCFWARLGHRSAGGAKKLAHAGETLSMLQWAEKLGIQRGTIDARLRAGWSIKDALEVPVKVGQKVIKKPREKKA